MQELINDYLAKLKSQLDDDLKLSSNRLPADHLLSGFLIGLMSGNGALQSALSSFFAIKASNQIAQKDYTNALLSVFYGYMILKKDRKMSKDFNDFNNDYANRYNQAMINAANAGAMGQFCPRFANENDFVNYWCPRNGGMGFGGGYANNAYLGNPYANNAFFENNSLFKKINKSIDSLICQLPFVNIADRGTIRLIKGVLIGAFIVYLLNNEKSQEFIFGNIIKGSSFLQGFIEEIKERFEDIKAELEEASQTNDEE